MKYTTGKFRAFYCTDAAGWTESVPSTQWGELAEVAYQLDGEPCRVLDCGLEGYADLEFLDGSLLEAVSRGHVFF
jgi:hypothetical protein